MMPTYVALIDWTEQGVKAVKDAPKRAKAARDDRRRQPLAPGLGDEPAFREPGDGRVGGDAADPGDLRPAARAEIGDDRERLERRLREPALDRPLEQAPTRLGGLARGAEGIAAGDVLEDDAAPALPVARSDQPERRLHALRLILRSSGQLLDRERALGGAVPRHGRRRQERGGT